MKALASVGVLMMLGVGVEGGFGSMFGVLLRTDILYGPVLKSPKVV